MAIGNKYAPLTEWLLQSCKESVRLAFAELNEIITIPNYAYNNRPAWANTAKPSSFCSGWINAGYVVGSISLQEQWVEFRKGETKGEASIDIEPLLNEFMELVAAGNVEIYNEFSLQHELGIFLRAKLTGYKVQFERNANFFGITNTVKHEIDIVIYNDYEKIAIELKYPDNGQYPEQMFSFIKDIKFMEELKDAGFNSTYCLTLVRDKCFYSGQKQEEVYAYFRGCEPIHGEIIKPTGKKDVVLYIKGNYAVKWQSCKDKRYYIVKIF